MQRHRRADGQVLREAIEKVVGFVAILPQAAPSDCAIMQVCGEAKIGLVFDAVDALALRWMAPVARTLRQQDLPDLDIAFGQDDHCSALIVYVEVPLMRRIEMMCLALFAKLYASPVLEPTVKPEKVMTPPPPELAFVVRISIAQSTVGAASVCAKPLR